jgi:hypothetical protein
MNRESSLMTASVARTERSNQLELGSLTRAAPGLAAADFRHIWWAES